MTRESNYQHLALDILSHRALLVLNQGDAADAATLLSVVLLHPSSRATTFERAQQLLQQCEDALPPDIFSAAVAHGRELSLGAAIDQLLAAPAAPAVDDAQLQGRN
ncbi:MAG TPA: hypothetical protein PKA05_11420 [Roseiflexaceae bacterium]|nr:hypothetical protein [Roseiflexaceae bacterium]